jgi:mono/diheme cytochrome c family protein
VLLADEQNREKVMPYSTTMIRGALAALVLISAADVSAAGQQTGPAPTPLVIPSLSGGDLFHFYCASCHGRDGKGDGPVASALNRRPPDLTAIAKRNGGRFPTDRLVQFVSGDREPASAHGSTDMPVWGPIFRALDPQDKLNRIRIENVVSFLESIQSK